MSSEWAEPTILGLVVALGFFLAQIALKLVDKRNANGPLARIEKCLEKIEDEVHDLHIWHNHEYPDRPGQKIWWAPPDIVADLDKRLKSIEEHLYGDKRS